MAKITLVIVLISMIMVLSIHSVVGDAAIPLAPITDVKGAAAPVSVAAGNAAENAKEKSSSWTDWAEDKISGIGGLFSSSSPSTPASGPASAPINSPAPAPAVKV